MICCASTRHTRVYAIAIRIALDICCVVRFAVIRRSLCTQTADVGGSKKKKALSFFLSVCLSLPASLAALSISPPSLRVFVTVCSISVTARSTFSISKLTSVTAEGAFRRRYVHTACLVDGRPHRTTHTKASPHTFPIRTPDTRTAVTGKARRLITLLRQCVQKCFGAKQRLPELSSHIVTRYMRDFHAYISTSFFPTRTIDYWPF